MGIKVYDRKSKEYYEEIQYNSKALHFLYDTMLGRIILKWFILGKTYSNYNARQNEKRSSVSKIKPFIEEYKINEEEFETTDFRSFHEFFRRRLKSEARPICPEEEAFISIADSKLRCYPIDDRAAIKIKNSIYTIAELIGVDGEFNQQLDHNQIKEYQGGTCLVFRLTVDDYHHYVHFDEGEIVQKRVIPGKLHTVGPISAKRYKVYSENSREVSRLRTKCFGEVIQVEVGALLVGKIVNHEKTHFQRGEEKGWFEMGGSTIVLLFQKDAVYMDQDIMKHSEMEMETKVILGEKIGVRGKKHD